MERPLVSVLLTCYNHENSVRRAIDSIMNQTMSDFELWITDDGSTDNTREIIRSAVDEYNDSRIHTLLYENNTCFHCIEEAFTKLTGKYFAGIGGDDMMKPDKLARQTAFLENCNEQYQACFTWVDIQSDDKELERFCSDDYTRLFNATTEKRNEKIRRMFSKGNYLCAPSLVMRRDVFRELGGYDFTMRQVQDFELWMKFLMKYDYYIIPEKLTVYGVFSGSLNHRVVPMAKALADMECEQIYYEQMRDMPIDLFEEVYPDPDPAHHTDTDIFCRKTCALLRDSGDSLTVQQAASRLYYHYRNEDGFLELLENRYGISRDDMFRRAERDTLQGYAVALQQELEAMQIIRERRRFDEKWFNVSDEDMVNQMLDLLDAPNVDSAKITLDHICALYNLCSGLDNGNNDFLGLLNELNQRGIHLL